jgi:hypothetical protein
LCRREGQGEPETPANVAATILSATESTPKPYAFRSKAYGFEVFRWAEKRKRGSLAGTAATGYPIENKRSYRS